MIEWRADWQNAPRDGRQALLWFVLLDETQEAGIGRWTVYPEWFPSGKDDKGGWWVEFPQDGGCRLQDSECLFWAEITPPDASRS